DAATAEIETAVALDPESYDVNLAAGRVYYAVRRFPDAIRHFGKATALDPVEYCASGMLVPSYSAMGDIEGARGAAKNLLPRIESIVATDPANGSAMTYVVASLAILGERERAKQWASRSMLLDPDNLNMLYN